MSLTPMMQQYVDIKKEYSDAILFFRLGDFYEMFFEDAIIASKAMEVTLTGKSCGLEERAPMCGVPHHAADQYITKLIEKGFKVAICEQVEDPATAKGIVKREVVRVVTPGTAMSGSLLNEKDNNYLAIVYLGEKSAAIAFCDLSTGEIAVTKSLDQKAEDDILNEIIKISAKEVMVFANDDLGAGEIVDSLEKFTDAYVTALPSTYCKLLHAEKKILSQFNVTSLVGIGLSDLPMSVMALGALLTYLHETQKQDLTHIRNLTILDSSTYMSLDKATIKNLELTESLFEKKLQGSLMGILDKTRTAMGSRKMKKWLRQPLNEISSICQRLNAVELAYDNILLRNDIREHLKQVYDLERLIGRIAYGNTNARDLLSLRNSIGVIPDIKESLKNCGSALLEKLESEMDDLSNLCSLVDNSIDPEAPFTVREGGLIKEGYSEELDELKNSIKGGQEWISNLEESERNRTSIKSLKVGFNKVFGYYIEITKSNLHMIPEDYIRKQTLVNSERFITPELKEVESIVLNAEVKINQLEYELFQAIRQRLQDFIEPIQRTSSAIAALDVLFSFAQVSSNLAYVKPQVVDSDILQIEKGRHPVLEEVGDGLFVSNDLYMDCKDQSMLLITGPNMSGKSTYMRQTALIVLMAQAGCFVPADKAIIGLVDRIYTRIGASDNLARGQSTFFVEMSELAYILNTATERSLIILDEIGRGTSTYDGLSIAWAVIEYLCGPLRKYRTLFATHYHELTTLENQIAGVKNLNVDVLEQDGDIVFLHKIIEGSTSKSYGIHVAKLAGVPESVLLRARDKLSDLEKGSSIVIEDSTPEEQISLFDFVPNPVLERLKKLDLMDLTPSQAFGILEEMKNAADE